MSNLVIAQTKMLCQLTESSYVCVSGLDVVLVGLSSRQTWNGCFRSQNVLSPVRDLILTLSIHTECCQDLNTCLLWSSIQVPIWPSVAYAQALTLFGINFNNLQLHSSCQLLSNKKFKRVANSFKSLI